MKMRHWVAALAVLGMAGYTIAPAMAGPGCGSKTTAAGKSSCGAAKTTTASAACAASMSSCGAAKTTTASIDACCPGGKTAMKDCDYTPEQCAEWMRSHYKTHGWLGAELNVEGASPVVVKVVPESPAQAAGFQVGDELTALNGVSFADEEAIQKQMKKGFKIGKTVVYTAQRNGETVELAAKLAKISDSTLEAMIAKHAENHGHKATDKAENQN